LLRETLQDKDIPHRTTIRKLIFKEWDHHLHELKHELQVCKFVICFRILIHFLQNAAGKVSLTTDIWEDKSMNAYMAVTAHYLFRSSPDIRGGKGRLELRTALIGFSPVVGRHFGQDLAQALLSVTDRVNITDIVHHYSLEDCASSHFFI
jgi:hypothetical protein